MLRISQMLVYFLFHEMLVLILLFKSTSFHYVVVRSALLLSYVN